MVPTLRRERLAEREVAKGPHLIPAGWAGTGPRAHAVRAPCAPVGTLRAATWTWQVLQVCVAS